MKRKLFGRDVSDTAFSLDRLFVWAVGITLITGTIGIVYLSAMSKPIPPQLNSLTSVSLGAFVMRITGRKPNE